MANGTFTTNGGNAFGSRPGQIRMPNPFSDLSAIYPNLSGTNAQLSSDIGAQLRGELSPDTIAALHQNAAQFGVGSGMPGSGFQANYGLRSLGLATEDQINKGIGNYNSTLPTISNTQTVRPETQADISATNAINASAPDPAAAASYAKSLFDEYLARISGGAGSGGGGAYSGGGNRGAQILNPGTGKPYARYQGF